MSSSVQLSFLTTALNICHLIQYELAILHVELGKYELSELKYLIVIDVSVLEVDLPGDVMRCQGVLHLMTLQ